MKKLLSFLLAMMAMCLIATSCSSDDEFDYTGEVTLTFPQTHNPSFTIVFYDVTRTELMREKVESLSYTTRLNLGNYIVSVSNFGKEVSFQVTQGKTVKIIFESDGNVTRIYK